MNDEDKRELFEGAWRKWGEDAQRKVCIEELAELIVALVKFDRRVNGISVLELVDEIADVEIMLEQIKFMMLLDKVVEDRKNIKLARLKEKYLGLVGQEV